MYNSFISEMEVTEKGKPGESRGRKATGLRPTGYDRRVVSQRRKSPLIRYPVQGFLLLEVAIQRISTEEVDSFYEGIQVEDCLCSCYNTAVVYSILPCFGER